MYRCKYCDEVLTGNQRKFCNDNHKGYYYRQQKFNLLKDLKVVMPEIFEEGYDWNENDSKMLKLFFEYKDDIQKYINILLEEKNNSN